MQISQRFNHPRNWRSLVLGIAFFAVLVSRIPAQEHLEPEQGSFNEPEGSVAFTQLLRSVLLKDAALHYRARVVCVPAGRAPWVVTLVDTDVERPSFFVEFAVLDGRPGVPIKDCPVRKARVPIDRKTAESVQDVWLHMLRRARYSDSPVGLGADGTTYHFSRFVPIAQFDPKVPPGWQSGSIWTPDPSSATGQLAGLGAALKDYALAPPDDRGRLQEQIRGRAIRLLERLSDAGKADK